MCNLLLNLYCSECEFSKECSNYKRGKEDSDKYGCVKKIPEDIYIEYCNLWFEERPFIHQMKFDEERLNYLKTMDILNKVYNYETVSILGKKGQITKSVPKK